MLRPLLVSVTLAALVAPAALGLHTPNGGFTTDSGNKTLFVPLSTAIWWDHRSITPLGLATVNTGLEEQTAVFEVRNPNGPVVVTAETFPTTTPDLPKVCAPLVAPSIVVPTVVVHGGANGQTCVKENGYTVQIHYFPWTIDPLDPDHVISPTPGQPTATLVWRVDAVPTSFKTATLPPGHWQVWIDPAVSPGPYNVVYRTTGAAPFYYDDIGTRGCVFYSSLNDQALIGCPNGYV